MSCHGGVEPQNTGSALTTSPSSHLLELTRSLPCLCGSRAMMDICFHLFTPTQIHWRPLYAGR